MMHSRLNRESIRRPLTEPDIDVDETLHLTHDAAMLS